jgi:hypothetical protein
LVRWPGGEDGPETVRYLDGIEPTEAEVVERGPRRVLVCTEHGPGLACFVCRHLVDGDGRGFFAAGDEEGADAWCGACQVRLEGSGGQWTDAVESAADVRLVCIGCWRELRERNEG